MKIAVITCYRDPDYIRARALRASLALIPGVEIITIKNTSKGVKRYLEVIRDIIKVRVTHHPDVYLLTFRGYEMLPVVRLLSLGKTMIFDELVNGVEWFVYEHKKLKGIPAKILDWGYRLWANSCRIILADTATHADASSGISRIDRHKYVVIPVSTDETAFTYRPLVSSESPQELSHDETVISLDPAADKPFQVFFYGYMLPLHGPQYVLQAAEMLKDNPHIQFLIAGRIGVYEDTIKQAQARGAHITYRQWVPFDELPGIVASSAVNIAGPFGTTFQAQHVINGKTYQFLASGNVALIGSNNNTSLFINHQNSLVVARGDAAAIAREIQWAYDNQQKLPQIAANGRALYDTYYSNKVIAGQLETMLKNIKTL